MIRRNAFVVLCVISAVTALGCKGKDEEAQAIPVPSGSAGSVTADPSAAASAAAAASASAAAAASAAPTATAAAAAPTTPHGGSVDACCSALSAFKGTSIQKSKAKTAAGICQGIAQRVKSGETTRSSALASIKASLAGVTAPAECN